MSRLIDLSHTIECSRSGNDAAGHRSRRFVPGLERRTDCRGDEPYEVIRPGLRGRAVLVANGWDRHWRTERYFSGHPFLTTAAAQFLVERGAALVGIDSLNIDDTADLARPVHTRLLAAGIPIVEHRTRLDALPAGRLRFFAVPPKVKALGTFPVRAFALVSE